MRLFFALILVPAFLLSRYTYYFYFFIVAGFILLVAMIGAIILTMQAQVNVRRQQIFQQVSRNMESAVFLVNDKETTKN